MSDAQTRTIDEIRATILQMPFAQEAELEIELGTGDQGIASIPLSTAMTYDGSAFAAFAVGLIADVAAGASTLSVTPADQMALTAGIESRITSSTRCERLRATATRRERIGDRLIYDTVVDAVRADGSSRQCGDAVITMQIVGG